MAKEQTSATAEVFETVPMVMRSLRKNFRARRDPDLTLPEFRGLAFINAQPGCALNELAEHVGVEPPAASKLVEHLVRGGLVKRQPSPQDRRRVELRVLAKGEKTILAVREQTREYLSKQLARLTRREQDTLIEAMHILKAAFSSPPKKE